jgi:hypothetical protein
LLKAKLGGELGARKQTNKNHLSVKSFGWSFHLLTWTFTEVALNVFLYTSNYLAFLITVTKCLTETT